MAVLTVVWLGGGAVVMMWVMRAGSWQCWRGCNRWWISECLEMMVVGIRVIVVLGVLGLARVVSDGLSVCDGGDEGGGTSGYNAGDHSHAAGEVTEEVGWHG